MEIDNLKTLVNVLIHNVRKKVFLNFNYIQLSFIIFLLMIIFTIAYIDWNGTNLTVFHLTIESYKNDREQALIGILHDWFSLLWFFIAIFLVFPLLLLPLAESFSISQVLWLRFTSCSPEELALARVIWIVLWGLWFSILEVIWVLAYTFYHQVPPINLLEDVLGLFAYILFSGGIIVALEFTLREDHIYRVVISLLAFLMPVLLILIDYLMHNLFNPKYELFFPYACPYIMAPEKIYHFGSTALIGIILLTGYWMTKLNINFKKLRIKK